MPINRKPIKAIIFDYGNTLVEFGQTQIMYCDLALAAVLEKHYGKPDLAHLTDLRQRDRLAPYSGDPPSYKENDLVEITRALVQELYGLDPAPEDLADILRARFEVFTRVVRAEPYLAPLLAKLAGKYRLGLLSNYPDGNAIRQSLARNQLDVYFRSIVVSGDLGLVKPHPVPFLTVLDELGVEARRAVLVGDNWLADVQGGKEAGLQVILSRQWESPEDMPRRPNDAEPDHIVTHLKELEPVLL